MDYKLGEEYVRDHLQSTHRWYHGRNKPRIMAIALSPSGRWLAVCVPCEVGKWALGSFGKVDDNHRMTMYAMYVIVYRENSLQKQFEVTKVLLVDDYIYAPSADGRGYSVSISGDDCWLSVSTEEKIFRYALPQ